MCFSLSFHLHFFPFDLVHPFLDSETVVFFSCKKNQYWKCSRPGETTVGAVHNLKFWLFWALGEQTCAHARSSQPLKDSIWKTIIPRLRSDDPRTPMGPADSCCLEKHGRGDDARSRNRTQDHTSESEKRSDPWRKQSRQADRFRHEWRLGTEEARLQRTVETSQTWGGESPWKRA